MVMLGGMDSCGLW